MEPESGGIVFQEMGGPAEAQAVINTEKSSHAAAAREGDRTFLISNKWFSQWCQYSGFVYDAGRQRATVKPPLCPGPRPGPVDNADLVAPADASGGGGCHPDLTPSELAGVVRLRESVKVEKRDFWSVLEPTWNLFKEWYGVAGPEVSRSYMQVGPAKRMETDHAPLVFKAVLEEGEEEEEEEGLAGLMGLAPAAGAAAGAVAAGAASTRKRSAVVDANQQCTVSDLKRRCCAALGVSPADVAIWDYYGHSAGDSLENRLHKTLVGAKLVDMQAVLLRRKDAPPPPPGAARAEDRVAELPGSATSPLRLVTTGLSPRLGSSPAVCGSPLSRSFGHLPFGTDDTITTYAGRARGLAGLGNLGNTCFMNSSLQCLLHSGPLMAAFLSGRYASQLNKTNPLGLGGKLAQSFGELMSKVWAGGVSHVTPRAFKWRLARFAPQFSGYAQQDSQELLSFLLDGLHEDLNRIQDKPYFESKDEDTRPDAEIAAEASLNYRARNDSVIVDHFQGMYKSELVCPTCAFRSVKFDPFWYHSLPLPTAKTRSLEVTVVAADGSAPPERYAMTVPKAAAVREVYRALAALCGFPGDEPANARLLLATWAPSGGRIELLDDLDAKVAGIKEGRSGIFASRPPVLLAYRYASPAQGPASGRRLALVFHKVGYNSVLPAVALYLSPEAVAALRLREALGEILVESVAPGAQEEEEPAAAAAAKEEGGADGAAAAMGEEAAEGAVPPAAVAGPSAPIPGDSLEASVTRLLAPFRRDAAASSVSASEAAAAVAAPGLERLSPGLPPLDPLDETGGAAAAAVDRGLLGMELEGEDGAEALAEPGTPPRSDLDASPSTSESGGDVAMDTAPPQLLAPAGLRDVPVAFNIWAKQEEMAAQAAAAAGDGSPSEPMLLDLPQAAQAAAAQQPLDGREPSCSSSPAAAAPPPYVLKLANDLGQIRRVYSSYRTPTPPALPDSGPLSFVAEWTDSGPAAGEYDRTLWEKPRLHASAEAAEAAKSAPAKSLTLEHCLEVFKQPEQLDADESWFCPRCKEHVQAMKKLDLWALPEVLVVHLKRFSYTRTMRDKIDTPVTFPLTALNLSALVVGDQGEAAPPPLYDLYAVSNHYGGMGGGHYTAYCQMPDGQWYSFDDSSVRPMEPGAVQSSAAYILFYRRQGSKVDLDEIFAAAIPGGGAAEAETGADGGTAAMEGGDATPRASEAGDGVGLLASASTGREGGIFEISEID